MRLAALPLLAVGALALAGRSARADQHGEQAPPSSTGATRVSLGSGVEGTSPTMVIRAELDQRWRGRAGGELALGLGAQLRLRQDGVVTADWDQVRDAGRLLRYAEARTAVGSATLVAALGPLVDVDLGRLLRRYGTAVVPDGAHTGVAAGARGDRAEVQALVDDVLAPMVVAAAGQAEVTARWRANLAVAVDTGGAEAHPRLPSAMAPIEVGPAAQVELGGTRALAAWLEVGGGALLTMRGDLAAVVDGAFTHQDGALTLGVRVDGRAARDATLAAPIGPLHLVTREQMAPGMEQAGGLGGAVAGLVDVAGYLRAEAEVRRRAGGGVDAFVHVRAADREPVQGAFWLAREQGAWASAAELAVRWSARSHSRLEAQRVYARDGGALAPSWQVMAWFGTGLAW